MFVIGTAGHVDHGKSLLVKAMTGIDPDRLEEEKKRAKNYKMVACYFVQQKVYGEV